MTDCQEAIDVLYEYLDNQLTDIRSSAIQKHLQLCRACFGLYEFEKVLRERIREKTYHQCPDRLKKRIESIIEEY